MRRLTFGASLIGFLAFAGPALNAAQPVDPHVLSGLSAPLSPGAPVTVRNLTLENGTQISLDLKRFDPFTADAQVVVHGASGDTTSALSSDPYFIGIVEGDPQSFVFLAGGKNPRGMISAGGKLTLLGPETDAYHGGAGPTFLHTAVGAELDVPEAMRNWKCGTDSLPEPAMSSTSSSSRGALATRRPLSSTVYYASIAVETDYEFYAHFGSVTGSKQYVADLFAAAAAIYLRDVKVILQVNYLSLWTTAADPWVTGDSGSALNEFISYWQTNRGAVPRSTAHFLSMRGLGGGIAYLSVICGYPGYGVSGNLGGAFSTTNPNLYWDIMVVTHEIGHNFSSPHTHCYSPPVDMCYPECYACPAGGCVVPPQLGTIMSYCHLLGSGYAGVKMFLGVPGEPSQAVLTQIRGYVENNVASCLGTGPGPTVSTVSPPTGSAGGGTPVTITGTNFVSGATVKVGGVAATGVNVSSSTTITATTPAHAASLVDVLVTNPDNQAFTAAGAYTYNAAANPPIVTSISPNNGSTLDATPVTLTGTNFVSGATVSIGGVAATSVNVASSTSITALTGPHATGTVSVVVTNPDTQTGTLANGYFYVPPAVGVKFYSLAPCRIVDTRNATGALGGPALLAGATRLFTLTGACNIPTSAVAVSANLTITQPGAVGTLVLYPGNGIPSGASSLNYAAGKTRANNTLLYLATDGTGGVNVLNGSASTTHFILDVNGYFK